MARWTYNFFNSLKYKFGPSSFYLLPTIEFCYENIVDQYDEYNDKDCTLDIIFEWLWFGFCITKYWGSVYER